MEKIPRNAAKYFIYIMPVDKTDNESFTVAEDGKSVTIKKTFKLKRTETVRVKNESFTAHRLFTEKDSRSEIFNAVIEDIVEGVVEGIDAVIMACGSVHSGKTTGILGSFDDFQNRGLAPRLVDHLFEAKRKWKEEREVTLEISCVEIKKNLVYDLLDCPTVRKSMQRVIKRTIRSAAEGIALLSKAACIRATTSKMDYTASASNFILTLHVCTVNNYPKFDNRKLAKIHVIDTMGIGGNHPNVEATRTKLSLATFFLRVSQSNIAKNPNKFPRFNGRLSPLIEYCGKALSPGSNLRLICHIRPDKQEVSSALSILKLGQIVRGLRLTNPAVTSIVHPNIQVEKLQANIHKICGDAVHKKKTVSDLKTELTVAGMLDELGGNNDEQAASGDNLILDNAYALKSTAERFFLKNTPLPVELWRNTPTVVLLSVFKEQYDYLSQNVSDKKQRSRYPTMTTALPNDEPFERKFGNMNRFVHKVADLYESVQKALNDGTYKEFESQLVESFKNVNKRDFEKYKTMKIALEYAQRGFKMLVDELIKNHQSMKQIYRGIAYEREIRYSSRENYANEGSVIVIGENEKNLLKQMELVVDTIVRQKPGLLRLKKVLDSLLVKVMVFKNDLDVKFRDYIEIMTGLPNKKTHKPLALLSKES